MKIVVKGGNFPIKMPIEKSIPLVIGSASTYFKNEELLKTGNIVSVLISTYPQGTTGSIGMSNENGYEYFYGGSVGSAHFDGRKIVLDKDYNTIELWRPNNDRNTPGTMTITIWQ